MGKTENQWRIPEELWLRLIPLLPPPPFHPLGCHRPRVADRAAMNAIFYRLRTGCQWKALSATGICSGSSAHRRFQEWTAAGVFREIWARGLIEYDELKGIQWEWLRCDGALTKAPLGGEATGPGTPRGPTDRAKSGVKRSMLVDGAGVPLSLIVAGANRVDFKLLEQTSREIELPRAVELGRKLQEHLCLDAGYDYDEVRALEELFGYTLHIVPRDKEARELKKQVGKKARRWVVERTHSWLNRFRAILIRWEKKVANYLGLLHLACAFITYRTSGLLG